MILASPSDPTVKATDQALASPISFRELKGLTVVQSAVFPPTERNVSGVQAVMAFADIEHVQVPSLCVKDDLKTPEYPYCCRSPKCLFYSLSGSCLS